MVGEVALLLHIQIMTESIKALDETEVDNDIALGLFNEIIYGVELLSFINTVCDPQGKVCPADSIIESGYLIVRKAEALDDILLNLFCSCGCKGNGGGVAAELSEFMNAAVVGAKVISPLAHTVGLVNCHEGNLPRGNDLSEIFFGEAFR